MFKGPLHFGVLSWNEILIVYCK